MTKKRVVVIGGGTGTYTLLRGLKKYTDSLDLTAIVTMADSGGSTGRLRDEFGHLPVGDVRMALTALATDIDTHDELLRELFLYRFDRGEGLSGHNFGNLLLTALTDILGSEVAAIETAGRILRINGRVIPVTTDSVHLSALYDDDLVVVGEHAIDEATSDRHERRIKKLSLTPAAKISAGAKATLAAADVIIFGPGDLYTSILANCVVDGVTETLAETKAKIYYVGNLMTRGGQTHGMTLSDHVKELARYIERQPDVVVAHDGDFNQDLLDRYVGENNYPVINTGVSDDIKLVKAALVSNELPRQRAGDVLKRSFIRHDSDLLAKVLVDSFE